jgi:hypothetical protein
VTVEDVARMLRHFNLNESLASEYVERTSGIHRAQSFTMDQLQEVLQGKRKPESEAEAKKKDEVRKNDQLVIKEALDEIVYKKEFG